MTQSDLTLLQNILSIILMKTQKKKKKKIIARWEKILDVRGLVGEERETQRGGWEGAFIVVERGRARESEWK